MGDLESTSVFESSSTSRSISSLDYGSRLNLDSRFQKNTEFTQRPDQAMLKETADSKNNIDLPQIPKKSLPLPTAKRFCLTADNFQVFPHYRFFAPISSGPTVIVCQMRTQDTAHTHTHILTVSRCLSVSLSLYLSHTVCECVCVRARK